MRTRATEAGSGPASPRSPARDSRWRLLRRRRRRKEVKVALIAPISGPWARQGELMLKGAEMAVDDINRPGGIKALGGAKLKLVVIDAGDSIEKAKNAAQRMVAQETDLVGCTGAWLSSFTLAVTEVTERAELPLPDLVLFRSDHRARLPVRLPDFAHRRASRRGRRCRRAARAGETATGKPAEDRRHRHGQHRRVGELRQADARRRPRPSSD